MATTNIQTDKLVFTRQLVGEEDLLLGFGIVSQIRGSQNVPITAINAATIPYDSTRSVKDVLDELLSKIGN